MPRNLHRTFRGIQEGMRVSDDEYKQFRGVIIEAAQRNLDCNKCLKEQKEHAFDHVYNEVLMTWKDADKYDGHWPIRAITMVYLRAQVNQVRKRLARTKPQPETLQANNVPKPIRDAPHIRSKSIVAEKATTKKSILHERRRLRRVFVGTPPSNAQSARRSDKISTRSTHKQSHVSRAEEVASGTALSTPTLHPGIDPSNPVVIFVRTLGLPATELFPHFRRLGITDAPRLAVLANLSDRDAWLDRHMRLSPIDFKILSRGLSRYARIE